MDEVTKKDEQDERKKPSVTNEDSHSEESLDLSNIENASLSDESSSTSKSSEIGTNKRDIASDAPVPDAASDAVVTPVNQAAPATAPTVDTATQPAPTGSSAGVLILQWLTYAFWGWTLIALTVLIVCVLLSFFTDSDTSGSTPYAIAATIVLLPISLICDIFYGRKEPVKKSGAATIIMVIHAVIFALFGIGALISAAFLVVQMAVDASWLDAEHQMTLAVAFLISAVLYALTFLRTLNPSPKVKVQKIYPIAMAAVIVAFIVAGFIGPVGQARLVKIDNDASNAVEAISEKVNDYVASNSKLPESISDLSLDAKTKAAVATSSITFKPEGVSNDSNDKEALDDDMQVDIYSNSSRSLSQTAKRYQYQLCADYNRKSSYYNESYEDRLDEYSSYVATSNHKAGNVCYKMQTGSRADY